MEDSISRDEERKLLTDAKKEVEDGVENPPDWLPDGWIMEIIAGDDGAIYQYFISPVTGVRFQLKKDVLNYLFSEMDERYIEFMERNADNGHEWLPKGWLVEIRAGGEKMYKFYVYSALEVRLCSKEDVLLYQKGTKITKCDMYQQCDTNSKDNILAQVDFNPSKLPKGWVKELIYRKSKEIIKRDSYYTDPITQKVFTSLDHALHYLVKGEIRKRALIRRANVHEVYNFEKSAEMHESFRKKGKINVKACKRLASSSKLRWPLVGKKTNCYKWNSHRSVASASMASGSGSTSQHGGSVDLD